MRVVFELKSGQNLDELRRFLSSLKRMGSLELFSPDLKDSGSLMINYKSIEYSFLNSRLSDQKVLDNSIFIPDKQSHIRLDKSDIYVVEADGSYIRVFTKSRNYHFSSNLKVFSLQLNDHHFIRVSRKHLINSKHLHKIDHHMLSVGPYEIKISRNQRKDILDRFPIFQTKLS
jgi:DNA-binding LytR/AlgR family response regulator